ncbi:adenylate kinase-domain-containing protein [Geranomyces variabilis]|nr:adenylate kinase-domain-containing protein [Geranomyces variabilis]
MRNQQQQQQLQGAIDPQSDAKTYFERKHIGQILECIVTGLTFTKPDDPLAYIEDCIHRLRTGDLPAGKQKLKWDTFIPPPALSATAVSLQQQQQQQRPPRAGSPSKRGGLSKTGAPLSASSSSSSPQQPPPLRKKVPVAPLPPISQATDILRADEQAAAVVSKGQKGPAWENIVFVLGGPGCGKGTQCARISRDYNYTHLSAGDLLRDEVATGSELGKELDSMMKEGKIVPMHVTIRLLSAAMEKAPETAAGFLIDGFPRQLDQAVAFEQQIRACKFVLYFSCSDAQLEKRLLKRGETSGRADDNIATIKKRFRTFVETSMPVIEAYAAKNKCVEISSEPSVDEVYAAVKKHFEDPPPLNHPNVVFVLGGPGSGKGTQCVRLAKEFNLTHLSSGDLLRAEIENGSPIGKKVEGIMQEGKMVPQALIMGLLRTAMEKSGDTPGFLIDGFPRAMSQAEEFEKKIGPCRTVLFFTCSLSTLESRLIERGKTSGRVDDNIETIRKRFKTFMDESLPVVEAYKKSGKVVEVASERSVDEVYADARKIFVMEKPLNHPNVVFILGGPGSGNGTQCARLSQEFGLKHISTGDLLRHQVETGTEIGILAQKIMIEGKMVPMDLIMGLLVQEIKDNFSAKGFLIDGFPRSIEQTLAFERVVGIPRSVLYFNCPLSVLESRLLERGKTSGRADDTLDTIKKRFVTYETESLPVVEHYRAKGRLVQISAVPPVDQVYAEAKTHFRNTDAAQQLLFANRKLVFVLGGPGSGKGTQCAELVKRLGWAHLSTGDLLREEVARGSELGKRLEADMKEGKMVSMEVTMDLLRAAMEARPDAPGFLIDGFPRTMEQAEMFERTLGTCTFVLFFSAAHDVLTTRLLKRGETSGRADDNAESIAKRLRTFDDMSMPVVQLFKKDGRVREVSFLPDVAYTL